MASKRIAPMHGKALQAFRNNDFTPESAIAEIIDNSIQAKSKNIKMQIEFGTPQGKNKPRPNVMAFGDDGIGMDEDILEKCLVLGESTRENDRKGIGRFGVGMTNGAISLCTKIEVYSRPKQGNWNYVVLNLKDLDEDGAPFINVLGEKPLPDNYKNLVGDYGTLVIWSNIDRIRSDFSSERLNHWLSRTFRKFIGEQIIEGKELPSNDPAKTLVDNPNKISIFVNTIGEKNVADGNTELSAFDPLYVVPNKNRSSDETAETLSDDTYEYDIHEIDAPPGTQKTGKITIRISFTPKSWRPTKGTGGTTENNKRYLFANEGVSILRNGREVMYGKIPQWTKQFDDIDRFWSAEINFEAVLDFQFSVKNIKVGARPLLEMREFLQRKINPTRYAKLDQVRSVWAKAASESVTGGSTTGGHEESQKGEKEVIKPKPPKPLTEEEKKKQEEALKRKEISEKETKEILEEIASEEAPPILLYDSLKASPTENYLEIEPLGNKTVVWLNMNHKFFQQIYDRLKEIDTLAQGSADPDKSKLVELASQLKTDIDNLIISYADSQNNLVKTDENAADQLEKLMLSWSLCLRKLYKNS
jgi:hypothetical protein